MRKMVEAFHHYAGSNADPQKNLHFEKISLMRILILLIPFLLFACKKESPNTPTPSAAPPPITGHPTNLITWDTQFGSTISVQNTACLQNGVLTIYARRGPTQDIKLIIPNFTGPGLYTVGNQTNVNNVQATYYQDYSIMAPAYTALGDSVGYLDITSYNDVLGLSGTFDFTLNQTSTSSLHFHGTFDQVRPYCPNGQVLLTYLISPFSTTLVSKNDSYNNGLYITFDDVRIVFRTTDGQQVQNPSLGWNTFTLRLPRHIEAGEHGDPVGMEGFGLIYERPSLFHPATSHSTNQLNIEEHNGEARYIKGNYNIKLSNDQNASGTFDTFY